MSGEKSSLSRILPLCLWVTGVILCIVLGVWNYKAQQSHANTVLMTTAVEIADSLASLLGHPDYEFDERSAKAVIMAAMVNEDVASVRISKQNRHLSGSLRQEGAPPRDWDGVSEPAGDNIQGVGHVTRQGNVVGSVEINMSQFKVNAEIAMVRNREFVRFFFFFLFLTIPVLGWYWHTGDLTWLANNANGYARNRRSSKRKQRSTENILLELTKRLDSDGNWTDDSPLSANAQAPEMAICRQVTGTFFAIHFAHAPALMNRLYAESTPAAIDGLCHLGRLLELAAACLGAPDLELTARDMQFALNNPICETPALAVDNCARALDDVLVALGVEEARIRQDRAKKLRREIEKEMEQV